ncbi:hypothetical protein ACFUT3_22045 [Streptomyces cinereoruber]|uniref:hypothetical protein n=1 Tax=Streptomyces cinereoruber TaxID=67260 RepID=UPI00363177BA
MSRDVQRHGRGCLVDGVLVVHRPEHDIGGGLPDVRIDVEEACRRFREGRAGAE